MATRAVCSASHGIWRAPPALVLRDRRSLHPGKPGKVRSGQVEGGPQERPAPGPAAAQPSNLPPGRSLPPHAPTSCSCNHRRDAHQRLPASRQHNVKDELWPSQSRGVQRRVRLPATKSAVLDPFLFSAKTVSLPGTRSSSPCGTFVGGRNPGSHGGSPAGAARNGAPDHRFGAAFSEDPAGPDGGAARRLDTSGHQRSLDPLSRRQQQRSILRGAWTFMSRSWRKAGCSADFFAKAGVPPDPFGNPAPAMVQALPENVPIVIGEPRRDEMILRRLWVAPLLLVLFTGRLSAATTSGSVVTQNMAVRCRQDWMAVRGVDLRGRLWRKAESSASTSWRRPAEASTDPSGRSERDRSSRRFFPAITSLEGH